MPAFVALGLTVVVMFVLAFGVERLVLRPLVNQSRHHPVHGDLRPHLFPHRLRPAGIRRQSQGDDRARALSPERRDRIQRARRLRFAAEDRYRRGRSSPRSWSRCWRVFFQRTRIGRALRAVADSHQAALSVGISLRADLGHRVVCRRIRRRWPPASCGEHARRFHFSLQIIALKALPVLILGGLTSIPGAIVGGLIIGVGEKLVEFYWGPSARRRHRDAGSPTCSRSDFWCSGRRACSAKGSSSGFDDAVSRGRPVQDQLRRRHGGLPDPAGPDRGGGHPRWSPSSSFRLSATTSCSMRC